MGRVGTACIWRLLLNAKSSGIENANTSEPAEPAPPAAPGIDNFINNVIALLSTSFGLSNVNVSVSSSPGNSNTVFESNGGLNTLLI